MALALHILIFFLSGFALCHTKIRRAIERNVPAALIVAILIASGLAIVSIASDINDVRNKAVAVTWQARQFADAFVFFLVSVHLWKSLNQGEVQCSSL
jgi:xanthine/uracil/vitamin C permease (AzgA family)